MSQANPGSAVRAAHKVLLAGVHLIENEGLGGMALLPDASGSGAWRCQFHPIGRPSRAFYSYSSSAGFSFLADHCGGSVPKTISPKALAKAIMKPGIAIEATQEEANFVTRQLAIHQCGQLFVGGFIHGRIPGHLTAVDAVSGLSHRARERCASGPFLWGNSSFRRSLRNSARRLHAG